MAGPPRPIDELLSATALLRAAAPDTLATLAAASRLRTLRRDEVLFIEGEPARAVYAVVSGTLRVFSTSVTGNEPTLTLLTAGALVGELGVLDDVTRSASVAALRPAEVVEIPASAFRAAYASDGAIARRLVALLAERLRELSSGLADLTYLDLGGRLAKYLLGELDRQGRQVITLAVTQTELGQVLGGARQSVNQAMQVLERAGLVRVDGRRVTVVDPEGLRRRSLAVPGR
jgi:CRP-like cAMP-binding protein